MPGRQALVDLLAVVTLTDAPDVAAPIFLQAVGQKKSVKHR
jgi:hypothetical protein